MSIRYMLADTPDLRLGQMAVRWDVFVVEQQVAPVLEIDGRDFDDSTIQIAALNSSGEVVGAARILPDTLGCTDSPTDEGAHLSFHIGRVAVLKQWRGQHIGEGLLWFAEETSRDLAPPGTTVHLVLDAQVQAEGFYCRLGYIPTDREQFYDAGILHQEMRKIVLDNHPRPARV